MIYLNLMKLPDLRDFDLTGKKVLLRVDYDVPFRLPLDFARGRSGQALQVVDTTRIESSLPTINHLLSKKAKIIILAHLGRPEGKAVPELSLEPVAEAFSLLVGRNKVKGEEGWEIGGEIFLRENLRFDPGEEKNDPEFVRKLAWLGDFYVNDAFAACHREHASIVGLPKLLPHAVGLSLLREVEVLSGILENPRKPVVVILGGVKEDKLEVIPGLLKLADYILVGGRLPSIIINNTSKYQFPMTNKQLIIGELNQDGKDITLEAVEKFMEIIEKAGTLVWSGPLGEYEEEKWASGTKAIAQAVVCSGAFKIIGGGDTEAALTQFSSGGKIDFISSGGGAMLEYFAHGDLPGLKALREK